MKELFIIAKTLTLKIINEFKELSIEKVEITYSSLSLTFLKSDKKLIFTLSTHHLDVPWQIVTNIKKNNVDIGSIEKIMDNQYNYETNPRYEITPLFLSDVENTVGSLVELIIKDLTIALPKIDELA